MRGHFLGFWQISLLRSLYVKSWRKQTSFFFNFGFNWVKLYIFGHFYPLNFFCQNSHIEFGNIGTKPPENAGVGENQTPLKNAIAMCSGYQIELGIDGYKWNIYFKCFEHISFDHPVSDCRPDGPWSKTRCGWPLTSGSKPVLVSTNSTGFSCSPAAKLNFYFFNCFTISWLTAFRMVSCERLVVWSGDSVQCVVSL